MLPLQLVSSASVALMIATWFGRFDDEARALTLSGLAALPGFLLGLAPRHSSWWTAVSFVAFMPMTPLLLVGSFAVLPPSHGCVRAHVARLLHCASWFVGAWTAVVNDPAF